MSKLFCRVIPYPEEEALLKSDFEQERVGGEKAMWMSKPSSATELVLREEAVICLMTLFHCKVFLMITEEWRLYHHQMKVSDWQCTHVWHRAWAVRAKYSGWLVVVILSVILSSWEFTFRSSNVNIVCSIATSLSSLMGKVTFYCTFVSREPRKV